MKNPGVFGHLFVASSALIVGSSCSSELGGRRIESVDGGGSLRAESGIDARQPQDAEVPFDAASWDANGNDGGDAPSSSAWRPFRDDSPWNTRIATNASMHADSQSLIEDLARSSEWPWLAVAISQFSVPVFYASDSDPWVDVMVTRLAGEGFRTDPRAPMPAAARPDPSSDAHMLIVHLGLGRSWDFWRAGFDGTQWTCGTCATTDLTGTGARQFDDIPPNWWMAHGARACGFPLAAGLITVEQVRSGSIEHALVIGYPGIRSDYYMYPASTGQAGGRGVDPTTGIPCGGRVRLDPAVDIEALGLSDTAEIIARALRDYGAFVGDYNGSISLYADSSDEARAEWAKGLLTERDLRSLPLESLQALEWSSLHGTP